MYWCVQTSPAFLLRRALVAPPRVVGVQDRFVRGEGQAVGRLQVGDHGGHRAVGRDAVDAVEVDLPLLRRQPQARVGEVDAAVGAAHHVVGPVQPLPLPAIGDDGDGAVVLPAGHLPVVPVAHDDPALQVKGQPVGAAAVLSHHLRLAARHQAIDDVDAVVHEQQIAVGVPQGAFGKREPGGQSFRFLGFYDLIQAGWHDPLLILLCRPGGVRLFDAIVTVSGPAKSSRSATNPRYRNLGITSFANSSIERITFECSMCPKDMLAPK